MSSLNFNLTGLSSEVMALLKKEAKRLHISVNVLVLKFIEHGLGIRPQKIIYHDLDHLAGTWSEAELSEFQKNTQSLRSRSKWGMK